MTPMEYIVLDKETLRATKENLQQALTRLGKLGWRLLPVQFINTDAMGKNSDYLVMERATK